MLDITTNILNIGGMKSLIFTFLMSVIFCGLGIKWLWSKDKKDIALNEVDLLFFGFTILSILSMFWATNKGIAFHHSFFVSTLFLYYLTIRFLPTEQLEPFLLRVVILLCVPFLVYCTYATFPDYKEFFIRKYLRMTSNSAAILLLLSCPFLGRLSTITKNNIVRWGFILIIVWIFLITLRLVSLGSTIIGIVVCLIYLFDKNILQLSKLTKVLHFLFVIFILVFFLLDKTVFAEIIHQVTTETERIARLKLTLLLAQENPILGCGYSNWAIEAYKNPILGTNLEMNHPINFPRHNAHNLYTKTLGELGGVGLIILVFMFCLPMKYFFRKEILFTPFQESCFYSFLIYLGATFFYEIAIPVDRFTSISLIAFGLFGIFTKPISGRFYIKWRYFFSIFLLIAVLNVFKYGFSIYSNFNFFKITTLYEHDLAQQTKEKERLYHPVLFSHTTLNRKLAINLAVSYAMLKEPIKANEYFKKAIAENPYKVQYLNLFVQYLIQQEDYPMARKYIDQSIFLHPDYIQTLYLKGMLNYLQQQPIEAIKSLEKINALYKQIADFKGSNYPQETISNFIKRGSIVEDIDLSQLLRELFNDDRLAKEIIAILLFK